MQIEYADVSSDKYYNKLSEHEKLSFVCSYNLFISFQDFFILEILVTMYFCWDKQQNIHIYITVLQYLSDHTSAYMSCKYVVELN